LDDVDYDEDGLRMMITMMMLFMSFEQADGESHDDNDRLTTVVAMIPTKADHTE
jgi:hypothetical protein